MERWFSKCLHRLLDFEFTVVDRDGMFGDISGNFNCSFLQNASEKLEGFAGTFIAKSPFGIYKWRCADGTNWNLAGPKNPVKETFFADSSFTWPAGARFIDVEVVRYNRNLFNQDPINGVSGQTAGFNAALVFVDIYGAAWGFGYNSNGQLGINNVTPQSSPIAVLSGYTFSKLFGSNVTVWGLTNASNGSTVPAPVGQIVGWGTKRIFSTCSCQYGPAIFTCCSPWRVSLFVHRIVGWTRRILHRSNGGWNWDGMGWKHIWSARHRKRYDTIVACRFARQYSVEKDSSVTTDQAPSTTSSASVSRASLMVSAASTSMAN